MPLFTVTTVNVSRYRYVIEAETLEHAYDTVLIDHPEELAQVFLTEEIIDGEEISKKEFKKLLKKVQKESERHNGVDNAHLAEKIICKVDYSET